MLRQLPWICILILSVSASVPYVVNPDFVQCSQPQCDAIDEILVKSVEVNAEPCQDFVKYACGKNISKEMYYGTGARYASEPVERLADLRRLLDGTTFVEENIKSFQIEKQIFQKCQRDAFGEQEMHRYKQYLSQFGADQLDRDSLAKPSNTHWNLIDLKYARDGFGFAFFDVDIVEREKYNEKKRYIQISPTSDNVLDTHDLLISKYANAPDSSRSRNSFGYNPGTKYIDLKNFISELNKIIPYEKYDDYDRENDNFVLLGDWEAKYAAYAYDKKAEFMWVYALQKLFEEVHVKSIDNTTEIILKDEGYFKKLTEILLQHNIQTIVNYIHLRFVSKTIGFVDRNYQEKHSIIPQVKGLICTPGLLVGTAHIYMKTFFPKDNKEMVKDIFEFVQMYVARYLGSDEYNPHANLEATKTFLGQLNSAKTIIGYDEWLEDKTYVSDFYGTFSTVTDKYVENQMQVVKVLLKKKLSSYVIFKEPLLDIKVFLKSFTQESIEFSSNLKQILFPARAFSEDNYKFLSAQIPNAINYGATGVTIASKIFELWLKKTNHLQNATQCISSQVNHRIEQVNTNDFLIKATAYLLGLRVAYESWPNKDSYPIQFPQFGALTDDRLFFLSFAEVMCKADVSKDEIHPRSFVNLAVSNMEEFSEAFQCYESHRMNRQRKCDPLRYSANTDNNSYL